MDWRNALQGSAILSLVLWTKVVVVNLGLGGAKFVAGARAPEDVQRSATEATEDSRASLDRAERMVKNDLENIPYTMALAWGSLFCVVFAGGDTDLCTAHVVLYTLFVAARVGHSTVYAYGYSKARSVTYLLGLLCSYGLAIVGIVAAFR